ncbi:MAG: DUF2924 domain-containing protein [Phycisphaerae bacterium]|nr:DUF2924 domain-containing protein [Phycisphaerae bacterium]
MLNVGQKVSELRRMTVGELRREYAEVFGEPTRSFHKEFLVRRIAWRIQANAEGGLPERARRRALEIANDADLRTRAPGPVQPPVAAPGPAPAGRVVTKRVEVSADARLPMPRALLPREYRGRTIRVRVLPNGFDYEESSRRRRNNAAALWFTARASWTPRAVAAPTRGKSRQNGGFRRLDGTRPDPPRSPS